MKKLLFFSVGILLGFLFFTKAHAQNIPPLKVTICHWDNGQGGKYTPNSININSVSDCQNAGGHNNHNQDIIPFYVYGTCTYAGKNFDTQGEATWNNNCVPPTITPPDCGCHLTPTITPSVTPSVTPKPTEEEESPTPTQTPTPTIDPCTNGGCVTPTPTNGTGGGSGGNGTSDGRSDGLSSCPSCTQAPNSPTQAVLGASTMASTGTFGHSLMNIMFLLGTILLGAGIKSYAKEKNK